MHGGESGGTRLRDSEWAAEILGEAILDGAVCLIAPYRGEGRAPSRVAAQVDRVVECVDGVGGAGNTGAADGDEHDECGDGNANGVRRTGAMHATFSALAMSGAFVYLGGGYSDVVSERVTRKGSG